MSPRSYAPATDLRRELQAAREIAHAFLNARRPAEVYRLALGRVAPLVGASFGCVFLRDRDPELLRVVAAYNWPQAYATYLSAMRVRVGNGPTGRAVAENQLIEAPDVFADSDLADWWDGAKELGFTSSVSIPLSPQSHPMGAVTFYFRERGTFDDADRNLLRLVADQLASTAEKAHLIEDLQRANDRLRDEEGEIGDEFDLALVDKRLGDGDGVTLITSMRARFPDLIAVIMTGFASVDDPVIAADGQVHQFALLDTLPTHPV